jgi:phosphate transport system permease protein
VKSTSKEKAIGWFFALNGVIVILILIGIFYMLFNSSFQAWKAVGLGDFLTGRVWNPTGFFDASFGTVPLMVGTLMVTFGAVMIALPLGIACATYLAEIAASWEREIFKPLVELLAGIPSVVIGFFGLVVLSRIIANVFGLSNGLNALNASILLAFMSLPTIISIAEDALTAVPDEYREASLALGATRWQTIRHVTFPAAISGVSAAVLLGVGRAIGETMTVIMVAGNAIAFPKGLFSSVRTMTATIAIELGEVAFNTTHYYALFAVGFLLFLITFFISLIADIFLHRSVEGGRR